MIIFPKNHKVCKVSKVLKKDPTSCPEFEKYVKYQKYQRKICMKNRPPLPKVSKVSTYYIYCNEVIVFPKVIMYVKYQKYQRNTYMNIVESIKSIKKSIKVS